MADSSFDIVSKVERQEVDNALNQTAKEISQRYDFKGVGASISWSGEQILMEANSEDRVKAILDVFQSKLIKRGISLKALDAGEPQLSGKEYKIFSSIKEGISQENAKKVAKTIRDEGPKGVKAQVQGEELRVSSKNRESVKTVQRRLGHSKPSITLDIYTHLWPDDEDTTRAAVEAVLGDVPALCPRVEIISG